MKGSNIKFLSRKSLSWEKESFTVLGIKNSLDLRQIIKLNYNDEIEDIKSLVKPWLKESELHTGK